jgi:translation elongation factor EF-G
MPIVDHLINSFIKYFQNKQKVSKKSSKVKRRPTRSEHRVKKSLSSKRRFLRTYRKRRPLTGSVLKKTALKKLSKRVKNRKTKAAPKPCPRKYAGWLPKKRNKIEAKTGRDNNDGVEAYVGLITHYFSRIQVVVLKMTRGTLFIGEKIRIKGKGTDFVQKVQSLQIESVDVKAARKGQLVGLKVSKKAKPGDKVYRIKI